ncbi:hypothetical protein HPO96_05520 [Kribbella sandramycini]|uniref:Uncharacterized protein n=1 Tax=Kribbella sandramycini TaxID=60450 RepID=A0A7Y4KVZ2_9ACTN|nr:hypothetical protein [Kribbella sandramycini]MBB6567701.1 hypothetical protein [Kribbella sandramycini]NOL39698.1 hypothetical protein [Kribbella sandramycini]
MGVFAAAVIAVAGVALTAAQLFNLLDRRIRRRTSVAGLGVASAAFLTAAVTGTAAVAAQGFFVWFIGAIVITNKWASEIQGDIAGRELEERPSLLRSRLLPADLRARLDVVWHLRYRQKMFRDPWSRRGIVKISQPLPARLMDAETIATLESVRIEEAEADRLADLED